MRSLFNTVVDPLSALAALATVIALLAGAARTAWRFWHKRRRRDAAAPMSAVARREHLARLALARKHMLGSLDLLVAMLVDSDVRRGQRIARELETLGTQDPALVGDMPALRMYVEATSDALAAVPRNRLGRFVWFTVGAIVPMVDGRRLHEARTLVESAFNLQEARVLGGHHPVTLDGDDVRAAVDIDGAIARFQGLLRDRDA